MLIAIMGDTFSRVTENKELNAIKSKLMLLGELASNIYTYMQDKDVFLFVVFPTEMDQDELGSWEGSIKQMNRLNQKNTE